MGFEPVPGGKEIAFTRAKCADKRFDEPSRHIKSIMVCNFYSEKGDAVHYSLDITEQASPSSRLK